METAGYPASCNALSKAPFNPPDWVFVPVWACLYVIMALAAWRVWVVAPSVC